MKKQYTKILFVELFLVGIFLLNFAIIKKFSAYIFIGELLIGYFVLRKLLGTEKRVDRTKKDVLLLIIILTISYYVITYFAGFFIGFVYTTYSRSLLGILRNVILGILYIFALESIRELVVKKGQYYKSLLILSVIVFTALELANSITLYQITTKEMILRVILTMVVPKLTKNVFLTFCTYTTDKSNSIAYQLLMTIPNYLVPVFPDFGEYISVTILTILPIVSLLIVLKVLYFKRGRVENAKQVIKKMKFQKVVTVFLVIILFLIVYLVSGLGRFTMLAIGSGSMTGTFNKGDIVFIDKKVTPHKRGDIVAFKQSGVVIVHRIVGVLKKGDKFYYITKGDANNGEDAWYLSDSDIVGNYMGKAMFLGWPTVLLSELIS